MPVWKVGASDKGHLWLPWGSGVIEVTAGKAPPPRPRLFSAPSAGVARQERICWCSQNRSGRSGGSFTGLLLGKSSWLPQKRYQIGGS